ncbi:lysis system o-spanin lipoprotein Rz1 [Escherichia coli]|uniref:lysis system o-spanin lipoprotein Rz1 n=1 Tax=Escherichia coli TaxID=562 RepID=UPI0030D11FDA
MVVGCSSKENALCHPQPKPPAPPAWAMMPPSNSLRKRLVRTVLIFTESSDQLSRATDRVPGLPASPGYVQ